MNVEGHGYQYVTGGPVHGKVQWYGWVALSKNGYVYGVSYRHPAHGFYSERLGHSLFYSLARRRAYKESKRRNSK